MSASFLMLFFSRCEDFLSECYILYKISGQCCGTYFDPKPYLSSHGTCFTTKPVEIEYKNPLEILGIKLNVSTTYSKGINYEKYGPEYATNAVKVAFHTQDFGLASISKKSFSLNRGTINHVQLEKRKVFQFQ